MTSSVEISNHIIKKLISKGIDSVEVKTLEVNSLNASVRFTKLENLVKSENIHVGIRAILGKKQAYVSSNIKTLSNSNILLERV